MKMHEISVSKASRRTAPRKAPERSDNRNQYEVWRAPAPLTKPRTSIGMTATGEMKHIFPGLSSFRVAAMILGYARYED